MSILEIVKDSFKLLLSIVMCELVGIISTPFTLAAIPTWYQTLQKPSFSPPNWVFGPVWTILYFLMGTAFFLIWRKGLKKKGVKIALIFFLVQLGFNFLWSILFFGLESPIAGLLDIAALLIMLLLTYDRFYKIFKPAAFLLLPYILWTFFASILNAAIVILNR